MKIIEINNLNKSYGNHKVLDSLNFEIDKSGIYALVGPNGSGKTTLFSTIANILQKDSGSIKIFDKDNSDIEIFKFMTFLKDSTILYDYLTGYDHLEFLSNVHNINKKNIDNVIKLLGIKSYINKKTGEYSLGMKQHLILAMNILINPQFMILDEPLNGLDPTSIIKIRSILNKLADNGTTILLSSHTLSEIDLLTDNIFFLKNGKIQTDNFSDKTKYKYLFTLKEKYEEIYKILNEDVEYNENKLELKYTSYNNNIFSFIEDLVNKGIKFIDVKKLNVGSESRYMRMYPEEIDKIRNLIGDEL